MILALIILCVILLGSLALNLICFRIISVTINEMIEADNFEEEMAFLNGEIDIDEDLIEKKFPNATILCQLKKNIINDDEVMKIFDISSYEKNHLIGLTYFVQEQDLNNLRRTMDSKSERQELYQHLLQTHEMDSESFERIADGVISEFFGEATNEAMFHPLIPNCTVYQLKDGRWLWRQEPMEGLL